MDLLGFEANDRRTAKVSPRIGHLVEPIFPQFPIKAALTDSESRCDLPPVAGKALEQILDVLELEIPQAGEPLLQLVKRRALIGVHVVGEIPGLYDIALCKD